MKSLLKVAFTICVIFCAILPSFAGTCDDEPILTDQAGCEWTDCEDAFIVECPDEPTEVIILS